MLKHESRSELIGNIKRICSECPNQNCTLSRIAKSKTEQSISIHLNKDAKKQVLLNQLKNCLAFRHQVDSAQDDHLLI